MTAMESTTGGHSFKYYPEDTVAGIEFRRQAARYLQALEGECAGGAGWDWRGGSGVPGYDLEQGSAKIYFYDILGSLKAWSMPY